MGVTLNVVFLLLSLTRSFLPRCNHRSVFAKFYANIFRCRLISEVGAEQMLLDVNAISTVFASLPKTDDGTVPAAYAKILAKGVSKCECFLKVLMSPVEPYEALVETYLLLAGNDANAGVFTRILDLKGVPRPNQAAAIDVFNRRAVGLKGGTETQLQPPAPTPVATTAPLNRPTAPSPAPSLSAASAANAAAVLQGALSSSVSTAAQLATAAGKSQTVTSLSTGLKNWMTMTRASTPRDGTPISGGSGSPGTPGGSAGAQASSAFAKMAALGQNLLSSAKGQPPPPPPKS